MAKPETLIDLLYKESFSTKPVMSWKSNIAMRHAFEKAHRFIADEPMSAFMADLATQAYTNSRGAKSMIVRIADSLRLQSRAPHGSIWIEYWLREYQRRSQFLRDMTHLDPNDSPLKEGWLIQQHPTINTAHIMHIFLWSDKYDSKGFNCWTWPFTMAWTCDESPLPWEIIGEGCPGKPNVCVSSTLYGVHHIPYHRPNVDIVVSPLVNWPKMPTDEIIHHYADLFMEWTGILRRVWSLLATIDNLPVTYATTRASRGFLGGHAIRRYLDHKVITLRIPERKDTRVIARKAIAHAHRKRHEVRAHWRDDWRHPPSKLCNPHIWEMMGDDPDTIICTQCSGRQFQIHKHERGDASLGYVFHDYELRH